MVRKFEFPVRLALRFASVWLKKPESPMLWTRPETESIPAGRSPRSSVPRVAWWLEPGRGWIWDRFDLSPASTLCPCWHCSPGLLLPAPSPLQALSPSSLLLFLGSQGPAPPRFLSPDICVPVFLSGTLLPARSSPSPSQPLTDHTAPLLLSPQRPDGEQSRLYPPPGR